MLNELYTLSGTLSHMGIKTKKWHREYKLIPKVTKKAPCFRLWLSDNGAIDRVTEIPEELAASLRKYGDNQSTFPAFNIVPLYRICDEQQIKALEQMLANHTIFDFDQVKSWCVTDNWYSFDNKFPDANRKALACLSTRSKLLLDAINQCDVTAENVVTQLMTIVQAYSKNTGSFRAALESCIFSKLQVKENVDTYIKLLFHIGNEKKLHKDDRGSNLSVVLDVSDWERFGFPIAHEHTTEWINSVLLGSEVGAVYETERQDAFGDEFSDVGEPMPSVKLKGFEVTLRAMFNAQRCQFRYGKIDDESYPISKSNRAATQGALAWIADNENQGFTWQIVDQNEIIFAYPSVLPTIPQKLVGLFKSQQADQDKTEARFADIAEKVIHSLRGLPPKEYPENIQVFAIRKMDKARTKVVFNRSYTPEWFIDAAIHWQKGCENIPVIDIDAFPSNSPKGASNDKPIPKRLEPLVPFPLQVPYIINNVWKQNGELAQGKSAANRMQYYQGMELLLDPMEKAVIQYYLNILLTHSRGLVQYIGNRQHQHISCSDKQARDIWNVISVIGLLLAKCDCEKGDYMETTAYLIGQILKVSDELHALYCAVERRGDVPPQLAGNAMFVTASETPARALAQLSIRMNPYIAWAKRYQTRHVLAKGTESWRAGWYLRLYESVATKLQPLLTEAVRVGDIEKAQVFLGYLAAFPKRESNEHDQGDNKNLVEGDSNHG